MALTLVVFVAVIVTATQASPMRDCECTMEWNPVCGTDGVTHGNPRCAYCAGARVAYFGECGTGGEQGGGFGRSVLSVGKKESEPCICTSDYSPVCGQDGETYGNKCHADCNGVRVAYPGSCDNNVPQVGHHESGPEVGHHGNDPEVGHHGTDPEVGHHGTDPEVGHHIGKKTSELCICTQEYSPVCGQDGETYGNWCHAYCNGVRVAYPGSCDNDVPQVGHHGTVREVHEVGHHGTYPEVGHHNSGAEVGHHGNENCSQNCNRAYKPVCGEDGRTYSNECRANCAGASIAHVGECA